MKFQVERSPSPSFFTTNSKKLRQFNPCTIKLRPREKLKEKRERERASRYIPETTFYDKHFFRTCEKSAISVPCNLKEKAEETGLEIFSLRTYVRT